VNAVGGTSARSHRRLRERLRTPLLVGEHVRGIELKSNFLLDGACDMVHVDPEYDMGITGALKIAHMCQALGFDHAVEDARRAVFGVPVDDDGDRIDHFPDGLVEFGLVRVPRRDLVQDRLDIAHGPSGQFARGL